MDDQHNILPRFENHIGKLFDRLDGDYATIGLDEYCKHLNIARQLVLSWVAIKGKPDESRAGSEARRFEQAFATKDDVHSGPGGTGSSVPDVPAYSAGNGNADNVASESDPTDPDTFWRNPV